MTINTLSKFMLLTKVDVAKKQIHGVFTAEVVDKSGEIADYETTKQAVKDWSAEISKASGGKSLGNIRKMHGKEIAGKAVEIIYDDVAKVIHGVVEADDKTIEEAEKGYLNGFSIGGSYAKKWADTVHKKATRFTPIIAEISVVDNPCVPLAVFDAIKDAEFAILQADGAEIMRKFAPKEVEKELTLEQCWKADDGSTHATKAEAIAKNVEIKSALTTSNVLDALAKVSGEARKRDFTDSERAKLAQTGEAMPDGSFPIKSKEDLHNAVSLYGQAKDKTKARAHIKARAKALGATDALPTKWGSKDVKKGMYGISRLACIIADVDSLVECQELEEACEGDEKSMLPDELKMAAKHLTTILTAMVEEESAEMLEDHDEMELAAGLDNRQVEALRKVIRADLFKTWQPKIEPIAELDALKKFVKDELPAEVERRFSLINDKLSKAEKAQEAQSADLEKATARIKELEAQPMPDKVILTTLNKGGDDFEDQPTKENPYMKPFSANASPSEIQRRLNQ